MSSWGRTVAPGQSIDGFAQNGGGTEQTADFAQMRDFSFNGNQRSMLRSPIAATCAGTVLPSRSGTLPRRTAGPQTYNSGAIACDRGLPVPPAVRARAFSRQARRRTGPLIAGGRSNQRCANRVHLDVSQRRSAVPGAIAAVDAAEQYGQRIRMAGNSHEAEVVARQAKTGIRTPHSRRLARSRSRYTRRSWREQKVVRQPVPR